MYCFYKSCRRHGEPPVDDLLWVGQKGVRSTHDSANGIDDSPVSTEEEEALREAKNSVKEGNGYSIARNPLPDGADCFEVKDAEGKVIELHMIVKSLT